MFKCSCCVPPTKKQKKKKQKHGTQTKQIKHKKTWCAFPPKFQDYKCSTNQYTVFLSKKCRGKIVGKNTGQFLNKTVQGQFINRNGGIQPWGFILRRSLRRILSLGCAFCVAIYIVF